jgi:uncharacterized heparinase superfamily protein
MLSGAADLRRLADACRRQRWHDAHRELGALAGAPRFVIAPSERAGTVNRIRHVFPEAPRAAVERADRIIAGRYDLLGYSSLRFGCASSDIDWHLDPVHDRRAPLVFWRSVPFLDPSCGDHKVIWELNRHQHWLAFGRAYWLTGDARYRQAVLAQLAGWLRSNPPLMGINWASMLELAIRSLSWIWALHFFANDAAEDDVPWIVDLLIALDRQLVQIERNLSYYFSPNTHLLGEALALYVAGVALPFLKRSKKRRDLGRAILRAEMTRQIAPDGGHRERSTHYHRYALDFYVLALAVARIERDEVADDFADAVARLGRAARLLADDSGRLPHFGDDDGGMMFPIAGRAVDDIRDSLAVASALVSCPELRIGPAPEEGFWLLSHPALITALTAMLSAEPAQAAVSAALLDTGYYVSRSKGTHLVVDAGAHGHLNGGHAHADALSLTVHLHGVPLLIDPGTACYTADPVLRDRFRSTASHNTLTIDGRPQSIPAGPFHWKSVANSTVHRWHADDGFDYLSAVHDGYLPLEHRRHVVSLPGDLLVVADLIAHRETTDAQRPTLDDPVPTTRSAAAHWHFDPRWVPAMEGQRTVLTSDAGRVVLVVPEGRVECFSADGLTGLGWHAPVYGRVEPSATLRITRVGTAPLWIVSVFGFDDDNELRDVELVPVWAEAGTLRHAVGLRIHRSGSIDCVMIADPHASHAATTTWRLADIETDAHALFYRTGSDGVLSRVNLVDGSVVRSPRLEAGLTSRESRIWTRESRATGAR